MTRPLVSQDTLNKIRALRQADEAREVTRELEEVRDILAAALPHIRAQIAADIRANADPAYAHGFDNGDYATGYRHGIRAAARIAEEGNTK